MNLENVLKEYLHLEDQSQRRDDNPGYQAFLLQKKTLESISKLSEEEIKQMINSISDDKLVETAKEWIEKAESLKEVERFGTEYNIPATHLLAYKERCVFTPFRYDIETKLLAEREESNNRGFDDKIGNYYVSMYDKNRNLRKNLSIISSHTGKFFALSKEDLVGGWNDEDFENLMKDDVQREACIYIIKSQGLEVPEEIMAYARNNPNKDAEMENDPKIDVEMENNQKIGSVDIANLDKEAEITSNELAPIQEKGIKAFIRKMINKLRGIGE